MKYLQQIQELLDRGKKPYQPTPVPGELLTHNKPLKLYDYQFDAVLQFLQTSRAIILYPTGFGKTFVGMEMMNQIKPRYLIIANKTAIPQWKNRIMQYLPHISENDYDVYTFKTALKKIQGKQYNLAIIDEAHWSLADTYSEVLATNTRTIAALTASPYRRDGRDTLLVPIFVKPIGGDWKNIHNAKYYNPPTIHIWVHGNEDGKIAKFKELIKTDKKCLVYCDDISKGKDLAERFSIPFVNGDTPNEERLKILNENKLVLASRIADESLSIDGIEVGIEMGWHGKSVRQALQRAGRLMHNKSATDTNHHIIMTSAEYAKDKDRFQGYHDKGLKMVLHKEAGLSIADLLKTRKESTKSILNKVARLLNKQPIHA